MNFLRVFGEFPAAPMQPRLILLSKETPIIPAPTVNPKTSDRLLGRSRMSINPTVGSMHVGSCASTTGGNI